MREFPTVPESDILERAPVFRGQQALEKISQIISSPTDAVFTHGTSKKNAAKIAETGLVFFRNTTFPVSQDDNPFQVATYSWKEVKNEDQPVNVIIDIPIKELFAPNMPNLEKEIANIQGVNEEQFLLRYFSKNIADDERFFPPSPQTKSAPPKNEKYFSTSPEFTPRLFPSYFIRGVSQVLNRKNFHLDLKNPPVEDLIYYENPNYLLNLPPEQQQEILSKIRAKHSVFRVDQTQSARPASNTHVERDSYFSKSPGLLMKIKKILGIQE